MKRVVVTGIGIVSAWVAWERRYRARGGAPMVDLSLLTIPSFAYGSLAIAVYFLGYTSVWIIVAQYVQAGLGSTALVSGAVGVPAALAGSGAAAAAGGQPHAPAPHVRTYPSELGEISGVSFAVWAPNAKAVRVIGDFNGWDGTLTAMRTMGSSGIWEIFVPGALEGQRYKFEIQYPDLSWHQKADPMARRAEVPPSTAAGVVLIALVYFYTRYVTLSIQIGDPVGETAAVPVSQVGEAAKVDTNLFDLLSSIMRSAVGALALLVVLSGTVGWVLAGRVPPPPFSPLMGRRARGRSTSTSPSSTTAAKPSSRWS